MAFAIDNVWVSEFDSIFTHMLTRAGGTLMKGVVQKEINGKDKAFPQVESNKETAFVQDKYDRRRLYTRILGWKHKFKLEDKINTGRVPDPSEYAVQAANECGKLIDDIIINGISGGSWSEELKTEVNLRDSAATAATTLTPTSYEGTNTICWADFTCGESGTAATTPKRTKVGLSSAKVTKAVTMLEKYNALRDRSAVICIAAPDDLLSLRSDPKVSNTLWSPQHSLYDGFVSSYGGVDAFVSCPQLADSARAGISKLQIAGNAPVPVRYAYIYCMNRIYLGCSQPLFLEEGKDVRGNFEPVIGYRGAYGAVRMFEDAVVRIEIDPTGAATPTNPTNWNI